MTPRPPLAAHLRVSAAVDGRLRAICEALRILPAATAENAAEERQRMTSILARGETPVPRWRTVTRRTAITVRDLDAARALARPLEAAPLYLDRLDELELDLAIASALWAPRTLRPLVARRYGTGATKIGERTLGEIARTILTTATDTATATATATATDSLPLCLSALAAAIPLPITIKHEPRLAAIAASGDHTVWVSGRPVSPRDALRLAVHEVLGHLVAAANARTQPLAILELGTAGSFADQEGVAVLLEEQSGLLDSARVRTLAARVLATDAVHAGASFGESARALVVDHGFTPADAIAIAERAHRGGGLARDAGYLRGWLTVRAAVGAGVTTVDELRTGRVSVSALPALRALAPLGLVSPARYRPPAGLVASLAYSLRATPGGTIFETSPPSAAASFTSVDAT